MKKKMRSNMFEGFSNWKTYRLGDIFKFIRTHAFSRENLIKGVLESGQIGNIHYGDIHSTYNTPSINLKNIQVPIIKDPDFNPDKEDFLIDGDVVMADASEDYAGVGVTVVLEGINDKKVVGGLHTYALRDENNLTDPGFRKYIFRNPKVRNRLQKIANGVSVYGISKTEISKLMLTLPKIIEQKRIVEVLETWDKYLELLDKKIEIKKEIRKELIKNLLERKLLVRGSSGKWKTKKIGQVASILSGGTPDTQKTEFWNGSISWITPTEISKINKYITSTQRTITEEGLRNSSAKIVTPGSLILCSRATIGSCAINLIPITTNQGFKNLIPSPDIIIDFLYFWVLNNKKSLIRISSGSTFLEFSRKDLEKIQINLPEVKEQEAISNILNNADNEIDYLKMKRNTLLDQKKFLLNNLITGQIRLPEFRK